MARCIKAASSTALLYVVLSFPCLAQTTSPTSNAPELSLETKQLGFANGGQSIVGTVSGIYCASNHKAVPLKSESVINNAVATVDFGQIQLVPGGAFQMGMHVDPKFVGKLRGFCGDPGQTPPPRPQGSSR